MAQSFKTPNDLPRQPPTRLIVGITGATGICYGVCILEHLRWLTS